VLRNVLLVPLVLVLAFLILPGCFFGLDVLCGANGIWGISFCLMLFAATLAALCSGYRSSREEGVLAAGAAIFLFAAIGFGE